MEPTGHKHLLSIDAEPMGMLSMPQTLPDEILTEIFFKYSTGVEFGALLTTSKTLSKIASDKELWKIIFDREGLPYFDEVKCKKYRGDPGELPQISWSKAYQFFNSDCKLFPGKKVKETHKLQLFYKEIDGIPMTLNRAGTLAKNPKAESKGVAANFCECSRDEVFEVYGETPLGESFWGFVAVKGLEGTTSDWLIEDKLELVANYPQYRLHRVVERSIANFDNMVETGEYLDGEGSFTICEETFTLDDGDGGIDCELSTGVNYADEGLYVSESMDNDNDGVALLREF